MGAERVETTDVMSQRASPPEAERTDAEVDRRSVRVDETDRRPSESVGVESAALARELDEVIPELAEAVELRDTFDEQRGDERGVGETSWPRLCI